MSSFDLDSFLSERKPSALNEEATAAPRIVPELVAAPEPRYQESYQTSYQEPDDEDDEYEDDDDTLSDEELSAMAESKAIKYEIGTVLAANVINNLLVMTPKEWQMYNRYYELSLERPEAMPVPTPAMQKILRKKAIIDKANENNQLDARQTKMLRKAILLELKTKNDRGRLKRQGVIGTVAEIVLAKAAPGITEAVFKGLTMIMEKVTSKK